MSDSDTLSAMSRDISQMKSILNDMLYRERATRIPKIAGSAILSSSNQTMSLNPNYYYSMILTLNGSVSKDVNLSIIFRQVYVNPVVIPMNNILSTYKFRGVKINRIDIDPANIGSATIYASWIGYDDYVVNEGI